MTKFEKIILISFGFLAVVVLIFGIMLFRQQKIVTSLKGVSAIGVQDTVAKLSPENMIKDPMEGVIKQFSGKIVEISNNQFKVDLKLPDFSKPKKQENFKNQDGSVAEGREIIEKQITVDINNNTIFEKKAVSELTAGDSIFICSYDSPYFLNTVTADKITYNGSAH